MQVELEDGDGNVHKQLVRGTVREESAGVGSLQVFIGREVGRILHLQEGRGENGEEV